MKVVITYDIITTTKAGRSRLVKVAKKCLAHGQRVQNSVFECNLDWTQYLCLQNELKSIIIEEEDSLRFYILGNNYENKIVHIGQKEVKNLDGDLII